MSKYTPEEEKELNSDLKEWQEKLSKYILSDKWDSISEQLSELEIRQIQIINSAESYKDVNWVVWNNTKSLIKTIKIMYSKPLCFNNRLKAMWCYGENTKKGNTKSKCLKCKHYYGGS